jgi:hypothetical protein
MNRILTVFEGTDTNDAEYESILNLWDNELAAVSADHKPVWYSKAFSYWESSENCPISGNLHLAADLHDVEGLRSAHIRRWSPWRLWQADSH